MKVLLVNGSPHQNGCTHTALDLAGCELKKEGITAEELSYVHPDACRLLPILEYGARADA